jgi:hypothetical protein
MKELRTRQPRAKSVAPGVHNLHARHAIVPEASPSGGIQVGMSYNITLQCGCIVYVACHPQTGIAHTRVIERRGRQCASRTHAIGFHLPLWELLPDSSPATAQEPASYQWGTGGHRR